MEKKSEKKEDKKGEKAENKEKEKQEENLEEEIDEVENEIDNNRLMQFLQSRENVVPVLEKITNKASQHIEQIESPSQTQTFPQERFQQNYSFSTENESRNYQSPAPVLSPVSRRENSKAELLNPMRQRGFQENNINLAMVETSMINETKRLPFESEDKKYREVRFKKFV